MPRFFFHFQDGGRDLRDAEGMVLPDAEAAWFQAVRSARDLFGEDLNRDGSASGIRVEIEDEEGFPILEMPLDEVGRISA